MQTETTTRHSFDGRSNVRIHGSSIYANQGSETLELAALDENDLAIAVATYVECLSYRDNAAKHLERIEKALNNAKERVGATN